MQSKIHAGLLALLVLSGHTAAARDAPLENPTSIPIAWNKQEAPTLEVIQRAIISGCAVRGWQCKAVKPGEIRAVLYIRKHMAESRITFDTETYSVTYVESKKRRYDPATNEIHRKYNLWVVNLISDINEAIVSIR
jgi:hypothetical protein